jgi:hypothetical protein
MENPTTVEWLIETLLVCNYISKKQYENANSWLIQEALDMEKQQSEQKEIDTLKIMELYADDVMGGCNLKAKEWIKLKLNKK